MGQAVSLSLSLSLFDPPLRQHPIRRESAVIDGNEHGGERRVSHNQHRQTNQNSRIPESGCCIHRSKTRPRWGNRGPKGFFIRRKIARCNAMQQRFFCDSDGLVETALNQHCSKYVHSTLCPLYSIVLSLHEDPVSIIALLLMRRSAGVGLAVVT